MNAAQIAETYVNGNISDARKAIKYASKVKTLDIVEALAVYVGYESALGIVQHACNWRAS